MNEPMTAPVAGTPEVTATAPAASEAEDAARAPSAPAQETTPSPSPRDLLIDALDKGDRDALRKHARETQHLRDVIEEEANARASRAVEKARGEEEQRRQQAEYSAQLRAATGAARG